MTQESDDESQSELELELEAVVEKQADEPEISVPTKRSSRSSKRAKPLEDEAEEKKADEKEVWTEEFKRVNVKDLKWFDEFQEISAEDLDRFLEFYLTNVLDCQIHVKEVEDAFGVDAKILKKFANLKKYVFLKGTELAKEDCDEDLRTKYRTLLCFFENKAVTEWKNFFDNQSESLEFWTDLAEVSLQKFNDWVDFKTPLAERFALSEQIYRFLNNGLRILLKPAYIVEESDPRVIELNKSTYELLARFLDMYLVHFNTSKEKFAFWARLPYCNFSVYVRTGQHSHVYSKILCRFIISREIRLVEKFNSQMTEFPEKKELVTQHILPELLDKWKNFKLDYQERFDVSQRIIPLLFANKKDLLNS
jgi:hypothetical protein